MLSRSIIFIFYQICFTTIIYSQAIVGAEIFGSSSTTPLYSHHLGQRTFFDNEGYRYTAIATSDSIVYLDSAGSKIAIQIHIPIQDVGSYNDVGLLILVYSPQGRYLNHVQIIARHNSVTYDGVPSIDDYPGAFFFSQSVYANCQDGDIAFGVAHRGADTFDLYNNNGQLFASYTNMPMRDTTMLIIGKFNKGGFFKWAYTINRESTYQSVRINKIINRSIRGIAPLNSGKIAFDLELFDMYQPYLDTLILRDQYSKRIIIPINSNDITLNITSDGAFSGANDAFPFLYKNTANNVAVQQTVTDGVSKYSLIKTNLILIDLLHQHLIDTGQRVYLIKRDSLDKVEWVYDIGKGSSGFYQLALNKTATEICVGFSYATFDFEFKQPISKPSLIWYSLYLGKFSTAGSALWQKANYIGHFYLKGLNYDYNNGLVIAARTDYFTTNKIDSVHFNVPNYYKNEFVAFFDSTHACKEVLQLEFANQIHDFGSDLMAITITINGDFFNRYYPGIGHSFINKEGVAYITGYMSDSLKINCNNYLYTLSGKRKFPYADGRDAYVIQVRPSVTFKQIDSSSCKPVLSLSGKYTYDTTGVYLDTVISVRTCDTLKTVYTLSINIKPLQLTIDKSNDISCDSPFAVLTATGGNSIEWFPQDFLSSTDNFNTTTYTTKPITYYVKVEDSLGCKASDSIFINTFVSDSAKSIPNVFTPNDDGINDCFGFSYLGNLQDIDVKFYNRWGNFIYQINKQETCWKGKNMVGDDLTSGTYYYILKATNSCGIEQRETGSITLIR